MSLMLTYLEASGGCVLDEGAVGLRIILPAQLVNLNNIFIYAFVSLNNFIEEAKHM